MPPFSHRNSPMLLRYRPALAAFVILSAAGLSGCGGQDRSASESATPSQASPAPTQGDPVTPPTAPVAADPAEAPDPVVALEAAAAAPPKTSPPPADPVAPPAPTLAAQAIPAAFARCAGCHSVEQGAAHKMGPNLFGVAGARAGTRPGYAYSDAMVSSGVVWTDEALDQFLAAPRDVVPGTKMAAPPLVDPAARASIVAYLRTLD